MDKYHGVHVKIVFNSDHNPNSNDYIKNDNTVTGYVDSKSSPGKLWLKNAIIQSSNGRSREPISLEIAASDIKHLEVLDLNNNSNSGSNSQTLQQQSQNQYQPVQQVTQQMQQKLPQQQQQHLNNFQQQHNPQFPHMQYQPQHFNSNSPFQASQSISNNAMHYDPAIVSPQTNFKTMIEKTEKLDLHNNQPITMTQLNPAILFGQAAGGNVHSPSLMSQNATGHSPMLQMPQPHPYQPNPNPFQHMFQQHQQEPGQQQQQNALLKQFQQEKQSQRQSTSTSTAAVPPLLRSIDPSVLFQSHQNSTLVQEPTPSKDNVPFQDPAIVSFNKIPDTLPEAKKPLFGRKEHNKLVKETVVFEDFSDFVSGKEGSVQKSADPLKKAADNNSNSSASTTPNIRNKKAAKSENIKNKPSPVIIASESPLNEKQQPRRKSKSNASTPSTAASERADSPSSSSMIPTSLIPPRARKSRSITTSQQLPATSNADTTATDKLAHIRTVSGRITISSFSLSQMNEVKSSAKKIGLTQTQLMENGAFGISQMVLKVIGGRHRIQPDNHNEPPIVIVLVGSTSIGGYGIAAARHLSNRGCQVIICMTEDSHNFRQYKDLAKFSGARIVYSVSELPDKGTMPVDIIVDTLLGGGSVEAAEGGNSKNISDAIRKQIDWANDNKAPILSVDFPSGVNADTCRVDGSFIKPKWTLASGAPYIGCTSRDITGELYLADAGLPLACFKQVERNFSVPWGNDFILALEYA